MIRKFNIFVISLMIVIKKLKIFKINLTV